MGEKKASSPLIVNKRERKKKKKNHVRGSNPRGENGKENKQMNAKCGSPLFDKWAYSLIMDRSLMLPLIISHHG
jgi:hypothetical protein